MAEFKDISEFSLKPVLDGQEEIQISAEYKTTLMQIAKLVLSQLFTLTGFEKVTSGFGAILSTDTLMQVLQKVNLGFSNGKARIFASDATGSNIMGLATEWGIIGFDPANEDIEFYLGNVDLTLSDDDFANILDDDGDIFSFNDFVIEHMSDTGTSSITLIGGELSWFKGSVSVSKISFTYFIKGRSSAVLGGLTQTTPPTLSVDSGWKLYKASNWDSVWAATGMKVITVQKLSSSSNVLIANVGLYLEA